MGDDLAAAMRMNPFLPIVKADVPVTMELPKDASVNRDPGRTVDFTPLADVPVTQVAGSGSPPPNVMTHSELFKEAIERVVKDVGRPLDQTTFSGEAPTEPSRPSKVRAFNKAMTRLVDHVEGKDDHPPEVPSPAEMVVAWQRQQEAMAARVVELVGRGLRNLAEPFNGVWAEMTRDFPAAIMRVHFGFSHQFPARVLSAADMRLRDYGWTVSEWVYGQGPGAKQYVTGVVLVATKE